MQSPLFVFFLFLSSVASSRVKVRAVTDFSSSSGGKCRVLAKWICQPQTYKENAGQVAECCSAKDIGDETLRKACCQLVGIADAGASDAPASQPVVEKPVVVETPVEDNDITEEDTVDEVVQDSSGDAALDTAVMDELAPIWKAIEVTPDSKKSLVQAFHHSEKLPGLSWAMSCVDQCEGSCESQGGECQPVQSAEDCETAAGQLSKSFLAYDPSKPYLAKEMHRFPRGCFVKAGKSNANFVRWNPPTHDAAKVKLNNVCGCYK